MASATMAQAGPSYWILFLCLISPFTKIETGFDVEDTSVDGRDDIEGLDASAAHVANLLSSEPSDVRLGIGGFSMGAATALHSAACYAHGRFTNGVAYPITLSAVIGLSGWLPCSRTLKSKMESSQTALRRAGALPILLSHGKADEVVTYRNAWGIIPSLKKWTMSASGSVQGWDLTDPAANSKICTQCSGFGSDV
uniref:Phospholipase/carboxylesterase/thioesterase domain-containing protein n=1 Tax=Oryza punctata TaxID=4537 RepID=A0A0E0JL38_ORYPU